MIVPYQIITEAEGLAELGFFEFAWEVLETLPPVDRVGPAVLSVRLMVCQGLARWELGQEIVRYIGPGERRARHRRELDRLPGTRLITVKGDRSLVVEG